MRGTAGRRASEVEAEAEVNVEAEADGVDTLRFATFSCAA